MERFGTRVVFSRYRVWILSGACLALVTGCRSDRPATIPVSGRITFDGKAPPTAGTLYFTIDAPAEGFPRRPTLAKFDERGRFRVTTWDRGDGLMPGRYKITVECWEITPELGGAEGKSFVPKKYQDPTITDLAVDIAPDDRSRTLELNVAR